MRLLPSPDQPHRPAQRQPNAVISGQSVRTVTLRSRAGQVRSGSAVTALTTPPGLPMDASADVAVPRQRLPRALIGLLLLGLWMGWAAPALWYQTADSPIPLCVASTDRR